MAERRVDRLLRALYEQEALCDNARREVSRQVAISAADEHENHRRIEDAKRHCSALTTKLDALKAEVAALSSDEKAGRTCFLGKQVLAGHGSLRGLRGNTLGATNALVVARKLSSN